MDFDYRLLVKYLMGTLSPEEMDMVKAWRAETAENEEAFSQLVKLHISWKFTQYNTSEYLDKAWERLNVRMKRRKQVQLARFVMRYAAVILLLVSCSFVGWNYWKPERDVTIIVRPSEKVRKIELADGSTVWLKSGSSLKIPETFAADNRKLSLQGEAFFDVAKNAQAPLYVSTDYVNIKVLGTTFNVKTNEKKQQVETVLASGKVALLDKKGKAVLNMSPGEKVTYHSGNNEYITEVVDVDICTAWRLNQLIFEDVTLREIANLLSAKFHVNINLESAKLARCKFRCVINEDESLEDVLKLLNFLAPIQYRIEGSEIFIYEQSKK